MRTKTRPGPSPPWSLAQGGQRREPPRRFRRAVFNRLLVPGARLRDVRPETHHVQLSENRRVIGGGERERRARIVRLGGAPEDQAGRRDVALRQIILAPLDQAL